jgi:N-acetylneuraminic acid mutarotase
VLQWREVKDALGPTKRQGHSLVAVQDRLFVFGGCYLDLQCYSDLHIWDASGRRWLKALRNGEVPSDRGRHTMTLVGNGSLYVFGGSNQDGQKRNDLFLLNADTLFWTKLTPNGPRPPRREGHTTVAYQNSLFVFGGYTDRGYANDLYALRLASDGSAPTWEALDAQGTVPTPRSEHTAFLVGQLMIVYGGFSDRERDSEAMYELALETLTWEPYINLGDAPSRRHGAAAASKGRYVFVVSGCSYVDNKCYNDTSVLDTETRVWSTVDMSGADERGGNRSQPVDEVTAETGLSDKDVEEFKKTADLPPPTNPNVSAAAASLVELVGEPKDRFSGKVEAPSQYAQGKGLVPASILGLDHAAGAFVGNDFYLFGGCSPPTAPPFCSFRLYTFSVSPAFKPRANPFPVENASPPKAEAFNPDADDDEDEEDSQQQSGPAPSRPASGTGSNRGASANASSAAATASGAKKGGASGGSKAKNSLAEALPEPSGSEFLAARLTPNSLAALTGEHTAENMFIEAADQTRPSTPLGSYQIDDSEDDGTSDATPAATAAPTAGVDAFRFVDRAAGAAAPSASSSGSGSVSSSTGSVEAEEPAPTVLGEAPASKKQFKPRGDFEVQETADERLKRKADDDSKRRLLETAQNGDAGKSIKDVGASPNLNAQEGAAGTPPSAPPSQAKRDREARHHRRESEGTHEVSASQLNSVKNASGLRANSEDLVQKLFIPVVIVMAVVFCCGAYVFCGDNRKQVSPESTKAAFQSA